MDESIRKKEEWLQELWTLGGYWSYSIKESNSEVIERFDQWYVQLKDQIWLKVWGDNLTKGNNGVVHVYLP